MTAGLLEFLFVCFASPLPVLVPVIVVCFLLALVLIPAGQFRTLGLEQSVSLLLLRRNVSGPLAVVFALLSRPQVDAVFV